jgi:hypothetical protein
MAFAFIGKLLAIVPSTLWKLMELSEILEIPQFGHVAGKVVL